jgi:putative membrane protein
LVRKAVRCFSACASVAVRPRRAILAAMKIIIRWLLLAAALLLVAYLYPSGVAIKSFGAAMIAAFVLGLFNTLLRPILVLLTLPVTLVTLGLFLFVINALMFYFAASVLDGFYVKGFVAALIGSILYSLCGMVIDVAMERLFTRGA